MSGTAGGYQPGSRDFGFNVPEAFGFPDGSKGPARELYEGVDQIDVRTKNMRALEEASLPLLFQTLMNPQAIGQAFGAAAGPVPGMPQSSLGSFLFGGSQGAAPGGQQAPGSNGQQPGGYTPPNYGPNTIQPQ